MGGHGGLNILPQKRWNVYNRDNRLKVEQDEAKQREAEEEAQRKHAKAESEHRHSLLLKRATGRAGHSAQQADEAGLHQPSQPLQHINFFEEEEAAAAVHPEVEKERKDELRRRGNAQYFTSDARFDERFQLGYGMGSKQQPWYASAPSALQQQEQAALPGSSNAALAQQAGRPAQSTGAVQAAAAGNGAQPLQLQDARHKRSRGSKHKARHKKGKTSKSSKRRCTSGGGHDSGGTASSDASSSSSSSGSSDDSNGGSGSDSSADRGSDRRQASVKRRRSSSRKEASKKHKHKRRKALAVASGRPTIKSIEQLRLERLQREQQERPRASAVLFGTLGAPSSGAPEKRYHSGFGYAPPSRKR